MEGAEAPPNGPAAHQPIENDLERAQRVLGVEPMRRGQVGTSQIAVMPGDSLVHPVDGGVARFAQTVASQRVRAARKQDINAVDMAVVCTHTRYESSGAEVFFHVDARHVY